MHMLLSSRESQGYITSLTHGINIWFNTLLLGIICKQSPHLDPHMDA